MDGHLVPTRIEVEDFGRRSTTKVAFSHITLNPELPDKLFTRSAVELGRPIPHLGEAE
jgi:outer membrane lipoprotein-sorting protein